MTSDGEPKICDFGLAKADTEIGKSIYTFVGTIHYMAPEIARGEAYDEKVSTHPLLLFVHDVLSWMHSFYLRLFASCFPVKCNVQADVYSFGVILNEV